jgi:hypothetical protein
MIDWYKGIPEELFQRSYSLRSLGSEEEGCQFEEVAWQYEDAVKVIDHCVKNNLAILGGDVLCLNGDEIRYTYDNWFLDGDGITWGEYVKKSAQKALNYITLYQQRNSKKNNWYVISATDKTGYDSILERKKNRLPMK